jgi:PAS domain S-box-containing protein
MVKIRRRAIRWTTLLAAAFAVVFLCFAVMAVVMGRLTRERDDLEALSREWLRVEVALAESSRDGSRAQGAALRDLTNDFSRRLHAVLDRRWVSVLEISYPELRGKTQALRASVSWLSTRAARPDQPWPRLREAADTVEACLSSIIAWMETYMGAQSLAFRYLLGLLSAIVLLGIILLLAAGKLLQLQEARFLAAIDSMSDPLLLTDAAGTVVHANPAAARFFSRDVEGLEGHPPPEALVLKTGAAGRAGCGPAAAAPDGRTGAIEAFLTDADGRQRPVSLKVEPVRELSGRTRGSVYLIRDLTEWKSLVASITSSFASLQAEDADRAIMDALQQAAALSGAEISALLFFNSAADAGSGAAAVTVGHGSSEVSPALAQWAESEARAGAPVYCRAAEEDTQEGAVLGRESLAWAAVIPLVFRGAVAGAILQASRRPGRAWGPGDGAMPRMLGSFVTELLARKWSMRELKRIGGEERELIEHANVPIWGVDAEGRVTEWNPAMAGLTGSEKPAVLGITASALLEARAGSNGFEDLLEDVLQGARAADRELELRSARHGTVTLLVSGSPRLNAEGEVAGAIFVGQDITARAANELRIKEQARALVEVQEIERLRISRDLHDDVAQNLSAARIACDTLLDDVDRDELRERAARLSHTIALSLDSIRGIAHQLRPPVVEGRSLAASLYALCEAFGRTHPVEVVFQSAGVTRVSLSPERAVNVCRIVQEGLSNADRHARATRVTVALIRSHLELILRITDNGIGFDMEQARVEAMDRGCMGLLGMRERAAILGGTLAITSRPGRGTQIKLTLRLDSRENAHDADQEHPPG